MRVRPVLLALACAVPAVLVAAQSSPSTVDVLHQALAALAGSQTLADITFTGTAHRIAGSEDEIGQATLKALPSGSSRMQFDFPSGTLTEIQNNASGIPTGVWSGSDSISHPLSYHNLLIDPVWFFPTFPIMRRVGTGYAAADLGQETRNGQSVEHIVTYQLSSLQLSPGAATIEHLSQMDFFVDPVTFFPVAITFNIHPDNNAGLDVPVEIRFSSYRQVNGVQVPFDVQKFLNNTLTLELQFTSATINSGLNSSSFSF